MIKITIKREVEVDEAAASHIANQFGEWLDAQGFTLVPRPNSEAATIYKDHSYEDLAREFVEEWG